MKKIKVKHEGAPGYIEGVGLVRTGQTLELDEPRHEAYIAATSGKEKAEAAKKAEAEAAKKAEEKASAENKTGPGPSQSFRKGIVEKKTGGEK